MSSDYYYDTFNTITVLMCSLYLKLIYHIVLHCAAIKRPHYKNSNIFEKVKEF